MNDLPEEEKKTIIVDEKIRMHHALCRMRSLEIELVANEESPLYRRRELLRTLFEVMIGIYIGISAVVLIVILSGIFD
jgi:hypothetical protein